MSEMVHHRRMAIAAVEQFRRSDNVSVGESFDKNGWRFEVVDRDCQEFCAVGHDDEKERIITWLSRKNFWTSSWL
ncbi:hypothetical protein CN200_24575, partial [Sinorhizobium meliloti]